MRLNIVTILEREIKSKLTAPHLTSPSNQTHPNLIMNLSTLYKQSMFSQNTELVLLKTQLLRERVLRIHALEMVSMQLGDVEICPRPNSPNKHIKLNIVQSDKRWFLFMLMA